MPVHGIDNGNNKHEVYTTEELLSILQQAIASGSLQGIDPTQTPIVAAVRESHNNSDVTFWSGTEAEFNELTGVTSELVGARIGSDGKLYILSGDTTLSDTVEAARQAALEATEGMKREVISVTLTAEGWSDTAPYTQTVAVPGMTDDKDFLAPYLEPTGNESEDIAAQVALSCISGGTTDTDSVTFYCYEEKPQTTITVHMVDKGTKLEPGDYPIASTSEPGMIVVGDNLTIDNAGRLSATGGGGSITVDSALGTISTNPVQNKVITTALSAKANLSDVADTYATKANLSAEKTALQSQINSLASGSPLTASSTSGMTDTTRIYVNTTNGHWYYYNGSAWTDGGVYQESEAGENSVYYNALTGVAANDSYIQLNAEDLPWIDGASYAGGAYTGSTDVTTAVFRVSKNTVIEISEQFRTRLTYWDINGVYIGNTGTFAVRESTTIAQDGWVAVALAANPQGTTFIDHSDITNETVKIKALRNNRNGFIQKSINFSRMSGSSSQVESNYIFVGKGTVIKYSGFGILKSTSATNNAPYAIYVSCFDAKTRTEIAHSSAWSAVDSYTVEQDCYIQIRARGVTQKALLDDEVSLFSNIIELDYVAPTSIVAPGRLDTLFESSTDISKVGLMHVSYASNTSARNYTSPLLIRGGTTITMSDDFVSNYHWQLRRIKDNGSIEDVFAETTDKSYTLAQDEYCYLSWRPIDNNWQTEDYDVDWEHALTSSDVEQIEYVYPKNDTFDIPDDAAALTKALMARRAYEGGKFYANNTRVGTTTPFKSSSRIKFSVRSGFRYGVVTGNMVDGNFVQTADTGWITDDYVLGADTYFILSARKEDNSSLSDIIDYRDIVTVSSYVDFGYFEEHMPVISEYSYKGVDLGLVSKHGYNYEFYMNTISPEYTGGVGQGFDIYDSRYLVQLYHGGALQIIDLTTKEKLGEIQGLGFHHGDTCQFSNTFYSDGDLLPLLYVVSDTTPGYISVIRIQSATVATKIKQYNLASEDGYYSGQCFDFDNNRIYSFGYKNADFRTTANNNCMIVSVYDMSQETLIEEGIYSLQLVERYERDFIYCIQGQKFLNGLCYLVSSYLSSEQKTYLYVFDPIKKRIVAKFDNMPSAIAGAEIEDMAFIEENFNYSMILGSHAKYVKLSFV